MTRLHRSPRITFASRALLAASLCILSACTESTGPDLTSGPYLFRAVAVGSNTCGLLGDSTLVCWGGSLPHFPTQIDGAPRFATISGGRSHFCGLTAEGTAHCWGGNFDGELGDGTTEGSTYSYSGNRVEITFKVPAGAHRFTSMTAGWGHTCGITEDGATYCWGANYENQIGDGTTENRLVPTLVSGGHAFVTVAAGGAHTCALEQGGAAYCWGANRVGELGDGTDSAQAVPAPVAGNLKFASVSVGFSISCGLTHDGSVYCWGAGIFLGTDPPDTCEYSGDAVACSLTPVLISDTPTAEDLSVGYWHTCAVSQSGAASCWGTNTYGQLGDGTTEDRYSPTAVAGSIGFASVSPGESHTCGVSVEGVLYCWGDNRAGQLGDGSASLMWASPVVVWGW